MNSELEVNMIIDTEKTLQSTLRNIEEHFDEFVESIIEAEKTSTFEAIGRAYALSYAMCNPECELPIHLINGCYTITTSKFYVEVADDGSCEVWDLNNFKALKFV